jgi:hypothetical protein
MAKDTELRGEEHSASYGCFLCECNSCFHRYKFLDLCYIFSVFASYNCICNDFALTSGDESRTHV